MFKKIFLITSLIIFLLCSWIFAEAYYQKTPFFNELVTQYSRVTSAGKFSSEEDFAKFILLQIIEKDFPPENWLTMLDDRMNRLGNASFYFFKVWFIESGTTRKDILNAYPILGYKDDNKVIFYLRYGHSKPTIQFNIVSTHSGTMKANFTFSLNNCLFDADYNGDSIYDRKDVKLAHESKDKG